MLDNMHNIVSKHCFTKDILENAICLYSAVGDVVYLYFMSLQRLPKSTTIQRHMDHIGSE